MKTDSPIARDWFEKASHDLKAAQILFDENGYTDTICFHAQQAVEKHLKGYLVLQGESPRNIHNLEELAKDAAKYQKRFLDYLDDALSLTRYYIETRYPALMPVNYSREEAKRH